MDSRADRRAWLGRSGLILLLCAPACSSSGGQAQDAALDASRDLVADGGAEQRSDATSGDAGPVWANPLVPERPAYPFPCDFYLVDDPTTATGRRVKLPPEALPKLPSTPRFDGMDGFSLIPPILAHLPGGVDPASLPARPEDSLAAAASVMLVKERTWDRVPILAEVDLAAERDEDRALIIRPLVALEPSSGYVVILTDALIDPAGKPHTANAAFAALRDGVSTSDPTIERQREAFELVNAAIDELELQRERIVLAWSFHTRSEAQVTDTLLKMQKIVNEAPLGTLQIVSDKVEQTSTGNNRQIAAWFTVPSFIGADGRLARADSGDPKLAGERQIEVGITIPGTVTEPRPTLLYGHGFMGHWAQGTRGSVNELCQEARVNAVSSYFGFNQQLTTTLMAALVSDPEQADALVAEVLQTFTNYTALARLVKEQLAGTLTTDWGAGPVKTFDPVDVQYLGASNGGTFGYVFAATSPQVSRATLVVGGGGLVHFLERAVQWSSYAPALRLVLREPMDLQLLMSALQMILDPIDSMSYARHLVHDRFPGLGPLKASLHMAVNDCQVRNLVTEWVARTARIPLVTPSPKEIYGLDTIAAPAPDGAPPETLAALHVYDEHVVPPPQGNLAPADDNGTHGHVRYLPSYKKQVGIFIETGTFVHTCDGPCDPD